MFMRKTRYSLFALWTVCVLLGVAGCAHVQDTSEAPPEQAKSGGTNENLFAGVRARIQRAMVESQIPGFAVAVARDGEILWEEGFGWADREKRIPVTPHTMFSLASVSKPLAATGLMVLVQQGEIDLDAPVNDYLPEDSQLKVWVGDPNDVTVRRLANHTAGLPRHENFYHAHELQRKPSMAESIRRFGNTVMLPGERYRYSNFGYGILPYLIEYVSGKSFADFMWTEVFVPLNMTRSSVEIGPGLEEFAAARYDEGDRPIPFYNTDHVGASDIYASAHDLALFGIFHLGQAGADQKGILSDEFRLAMQVPTASMNPANPPDTPSAPGSYYGIGWVLDDNAMGKQVSHTGGMGGVATRIALMPDEGIVVVAVANKSCHLPWWIEREILAVLVPDYSERIEKYRQERRGGRRRNRPQEYKPVPELLGDWEGEVHTYEGNCPMTLSFKESGDIIATLVKSEERYPWPVLVVDATFTNNRFMGKMAGRIFTRDSNRRRRVTPFHHLDLDLTLRDDVLNGAVIAIAGNSLSYWVELHKKQEPQTTDETEPADQPDQTAAP